MKRNSRVIPWLVGLLFVMMGGVVACNKKNKNGDDTTTTTTQKIVTPPAALQFNIAATPGVCEATDGTGAVISQLSLVAGQTVTYCNQRTMKAQVKFSVPGFVPGGTDLNLNPGECVTHVVESGVVDGDYSWTMTCEDVTGGGGGPVKVDNPPPGP